MLRKVGFVQNNPIFGETERNVRRALELASTVEADLLVLPELFNTGYLFTTKEEVERLAEPLDGILLLVRSSFMRKYNRFIRIKSAKK